MSLETFGILRQYGHAPRSDMYKPRPSVGRHSGIRAKVMISCHKDIRAGLGHGQRC